METKERYSVRDCIETAYYCDIGGKVTVLDDKSLPANYKNQLFYCIGGDGSISNPKLVNSVFMVSLISGEKSKWKRSDVIGVLKPELLPDTAKLHLSQIRPSSAQSLTHLEPKYSGYSFLPDGSYSSGVWLCSSQEVRDYVEMQKPYQHRILICDRNDFAVLEMIDGLLIYPTEADLNASNLKQEEQSGGMEMK